MDDLVDGLMRLMGTPETVTRLVNLGNLGEFSIRELAEPVIGLPTRAALTSSGYGLD